MGGAESTSARLRDLAPTLLVLAAALVLGIWTVTAAGADPATIGPRTEFTAGHVLAAALARAQVEMTGFFRTTTPLVGWPEHAEFRAVMWPTQILALFVPPVTAVTCAFALYPAFNALGGYVLGRALGLDRWGCATVAGLCAWSPWVREVLANGQLEQAATGAVAIGWALAIGAARSSRWVVPMFLWFLVFALSAPHLALGACVGAVAWAAVDLATTRPWASIRAARWGIALGAAGAGALLASAYHASNFVGTVQVFWPKGSPGHPTDLPGLPDVASAGSVFLPPWGIPAQTGVVHPTYLGGVALFAAIIGLARHRRWPLVAALIVLVSMSFGDHFGPFPGPFRVLSLVSATIAKSSSPYRMVGAAIVALAALAGSAARGPAALLVVALAWIETSLVATRPLPYPRMEFYRDSVADVFRARTGGILDLPLVGGKCPAASEHYALEAARRHRPTPVLVSAPAVYPTITGLGRKTLLAWQTRPCGPALDRLIHDVGFTGVVLHHHDPSCPVPASFEACLLDALGPGEVAADVRWWDPLPPLSAEAAALPADLFGGPGGRPRGR